MKTISELRQPGVPRKGATTVEFALVVPIMFAVFFGAIEFSRANQVTNATAFSAYQGCRQAIIPGGSVSAATAAAQQVLTSNLISSGTTITITPSTITDSTTTVTVDVSVSLDSVGWITPKFTKSKTITRSCTLTREKTN
jgi:Flp pilus assembly protein TadG